MESSSLNDRLWSIETLTMDSESLATIQEVLERLFTFRHEAKSIPSQLSDAEHDVLSSFFVALRTRWSFDISFESTPCLSSFDCNAIIHENDSRLLCEAKTLCSLICAAEGTFTFSE